MLLYYVNDETYLISSASLQPHFFAHPPTPPRRLSSSRRLPRWRPLPLGKRARGRARGRPPPLSSATPQRTNAMANRRCGCLRQCRRRRGGDDNGGGSPRPHCGLIEIMMCYFFTETKFDTINSYVTLEQLFWHTKILTDISPECKSRRI
jgi:hypothetical protein